MSTIGQRVRFGRLVWTLLVTFYFLVFFRNFFRDALQGASVIPTVFSYLFVLWLAVEYYLGSPFFQSGIVEHSSLWRGVFAFFVYPFLGFVAADHIWLHWTQVPVPAVVGGVLGMLVFAAGTYLRLDVLFAVTRLAGTAGARPAIPLRKVPELKPYRMCRHPRYLATLVQIAGAALVFVSWGGLVLAFGIGLPLVLLQARYEDRVLETKLKAEFRDYARRVPLLWPRFRSG